jgi:hypothetical protein
VKGLCGKAVYKRIRLKEYKRKREEFRDCERAL